MKRKALIAVSSLALILFTFTQCSKKSTSVDNDTPLLNAAKVTTGFTYYKSDTSYHASTSGSGHLFPYFRVRFNSIAQAALTDNGKLPVGGSFPTGSFIVKELYDSAHVLQQYALMKKDPTNSVSGNGWVWSEIQPNGTVVISANDKGSNTCIDCHGFSDRDNNKTFQTYP